LGVSLPDRMRLLGHKHDRITLRDVQDTQQDLQRELHIAGENPPQLDHLRLVDNQTVTPGGFAAHFCGLSKSRAPCNP
jgi:hypothetical protein